MISTTSFLLVLFSLSSSFTIAAKFDPIDNLPSSLGNAYPHRFAADRADGHKVVPIVVHPGNEKGTIAPLIVMVGSKGEGRGRKGFQLPRGKQKDVESVHQAARRTAMREAGFHSSDLVPIGESIHAHDGPHTVSAQVYQVKSDAKRYLNDGRAVQFENYLGTRFQTKSPAMRSVLDKASSSIFLPRVPEAE